MGKCGLNLDKESIEHMNFRLSCHAKDRETPFPECDLQEILRALNSVEVLQTLQNMATGEEFSPGRCVAYFKAHIQSGKL